MSWDPLDLPATSVVIRLVRDDPQFIPTAEATRPLRVAFRLTEADFAEARRRGWPALLSVFDSAKVTWEEARQVRRSACVPFLLRVGDVVAVPIPGEQGHLRVVADRFDDPSPVGAAHAGICGLDPDRRPDGSCRPAPLSKVSVKSLQEKLAALCFRPKACPA
jgi:hypothetical protein